MVSPIVPAVIIGGVAYVATQGDGDPKEGTRPTAPLPGQTLEQVAAGTVRKSTTATYTPVTVSRRIYQLQATARPQASSVAFAYDPSKPAGPGGGYPVDPELQKKLDEIEAAAEKAYNDMDEVARAEAVDKMNKELELDPPLEYGADWKTISAAAGGYAGAAAGTAICGPVCGKIGAMAGAYLGVQLEELIAKNWDELEAWIKDKWGDVKQYVGEAYEDAKDAVEGAYEDTKEAVEDAYDDAADYVSGLNPF